MYGKSTEIIPWKLPELLRTLGCYKIRVYKCFRKFMELLGTANIALGWQALGWDLADSGVEIGIVEQL